jgi:hypothetical protein
MEATRPAARAMMYALLAITVAAIGFGIYTSREKAATPRPAIQAPPAPAGPLVAVRPVHDFGTISMAAGKVSHRFWVTNEGDVPVAITRIYTSCMCTEAWLLSPSSRRGPFGMPGHGVLPSVYEQVFPGRSVQLQLVFDPAAHGPAGLGPVDRIVTLNNDAGPPLDLRIAAMVRP